MHENMVIFGTAFIFLRHYWWWRWWGRGSKQSYQVRLAACSCPSCHALFPYKCLWRKRACRCQRAQSGLVKGTLLGVVDIEIVWRECRWRWRRSLHGVHGLRHLRHLLSEHGTCPHAHAISQHLITMPLHLYLTDEDVEKIICVVNNFVK